MYTFYDLIVECIHSMISPQNVYILRLSAFYTTYTLYTLCIFIMNCMLDTKPGHLLDIETSDLLQRNSGSNRSKKQQKLKNVRNKRQRKDDD